MATDIPTFSDAVKLVQERQDLFFNSSNPILTGYTMTNRKGTSVSLPNIIGLPPVGSDPAVRGSEKYTLSDVVRDTMPILEIIPAEQQIHTGLEMFSLVESFKEYCRELQEKYLIKVSVDKESDVALKVACLNVSQPSETFTNEFGESSIGHTVTPGASDILSELAFMSGGTSLLKTGENFGRAAKDLGEGLAGKALEKVAGHIKEFGQKQQELLKARTRTGTFTRMAFLTAALAAGRKIDFPTIWKTSTFSASYSVSVRLYNPNPGDLQSTNKFIMAPMAALLMFVVPRTNDGYTFFWPWLCQYRMKGLFDIKGGFVRSITVIKGGDDNNIAYNQRPGIVDLKIELGTLYQSMISNKNQGTSDIPALTEYLEGFSEKKDWANNEKKIKTPNWIDPDIKDFLAEGSPPETDLVLEAMHSSAQQSPQDRTTDNRITTENLKTSLALIKAFAGF